MNEPARFDAITLEILWKRLISIMDEVDLAVIRTSFSTIVGESRDFACILLNERGESLAQSTFSTPNFTVTLPVTVKEFVRRFPVETLQEGDVLATNNPWIASGHLPDFSIATPVFFRGRVVAFMGTVAHLADIGGRLGYFDARDVFEEGFRLPPVKLFSAGQPDEVLLEVLAANVRVPDMVIGDIHAIIGAQRVGVRRLQEFLEDSHLTDLRRLSHEIHGRSEAAMRAAISAIPDGMYRDEIVVDGYKKPVTIRCALEVARDTIHVDYTGSSPQTAEAAINVVEAATFAATIYPLKCSLVPDIPNNEGLFRPVQVYAPPGSILNCRFPAAVRSRSKVSFHLHSAIYKALAAVIPEKVQAGSGAFWSFTAHGYDELDTPFSVHFLPWGGIGATDVLDGLSTTAFPLNGSATPAEIVENNSPLTIRRRELMPDSGGAGRHRGGLGQRVVVGSISERPATVAVRPDKLRYPPIGLLGGADAPPGRCRLNGEDVTADTPFQFARGDELVMEIPGGAGFGPPRERAIEDVERDLLQGLVTAEAATLEYRAASDPATGRMDQAKAVELRGKGEPPREDNLRE